MWAGHRCVGRDIASVEIRVLRHVEVRRVALLDGRTDGVREPRVGPIPRAAISRDRAIDRVRPRRGLAALDKLSELPCRKRDVGAMVRTTRRSPTVG